MSKKTEEPSHELQHCDCGCEHHHGKALLIHPERRDEFDAWRQSIAEAKSGSALLDILLKPVNASALLNALPVDDLSMAIHKIGLEDCTELLEALPGSRIQALLDTDIWEGDLPSVQRLDPWLQALMEAGPDVIKSKMLGLDDPLLDWILRRSIEVKVLEDPDDFEPPVIDGQEMEYVFGPDRHLCILFTGESPSEMPIKIFLDRLMGEDPSFATDLLVFTGAALDSTLEEDALRLRNARLADRGYVDYYDALSIYAPFKGEPPAPDRTRPEEAPPERWLAIPQKGDRLDQAMAKLPSFARESVEAELGYLANQACSADRIELWDEKGVAQVLQRLRQGLTLGFDLLTVSEDDSDVEILSNTPLQLIFRQGYTAVKQAAEPLNKAVRQGHFKGPESRTDGVEPGIFSERLLSLYARHPSLNGKMPTTFAELREFHAEVLHMVELGQVGTAVDGTLEALPRPKDVGLVAWIVASMLRLLIGLPDRGLLPMERAAEGLQAFDAASDDDLFGVWQKLGGHTHEVLQSLLNEVAPALKAAAQNETCDLTTLPIAYALPQEI